MNTQITTTRQSAMMSSREIAKLTGKKISQVHSDIRAMIPSLYAIDNGENVRSYAWGTTKDEMIAFLNHHNIQGINFNLDDRGYVYEFLLDRRHTEILITGYDVKRRAAVIDRWFTLEIQNQQPVDPMAALNDPQILRGTLLSYTERVITLEHQVEDMKPEVEAFERIAKSDGGMCITDAAKHLQIKPTQLFKEMSQRRWIYRRAGGKSWIGYQDKIQSGVLEHKVTTVSKSDGSERVVEQVLVTPKGLTRLSKMLGVDNRQPALL
ncbi:TPA: phage antirepressor KilAC domain-containing protein [Salmonella enterica subsp. enterica serovar Muenchen]